MEPECKFLAREGGCKCKFKIKARVENTRYQGQSSSYGQTSGATETRLTENKQYENNNVGGGSLSGNTGGCAQVYQGGNSGYRSSYEYENVQYLGVCMRSQGE